jgi:hypothetical protein
MDERDEEEDLWQEDREPAMDGVIRRVEHMDGKRSYRTTPQKWQAAWMTMKFKSN